MHTSIFHIQAIQAYFSEYPMGIHENQMVIRFIKSISEKIEINKNELLLSLSPIFKSGSSQKTTT